MTFDFNNWCAAGEVFEHDGENELRLAEQPSLVVALVSSGRCGVPAEGQTLMAGAGALVLCPGRLHLVPVGGAHILGARLQGGAPMELAAGLPGPLVLNGTACPGAAELLGQLAAREMKPADSSALSYALLCQLATADADARPLPQLVAAAIEHIRDHYAEVYGIEELAASLGVSKSHLVRSFSAATGTTPGKYLTAVRVEAAKRLLSGREEYTLDVIASLCGFSGANYLCKVFKKATGDTPALWRAKASPAQQAPQRHELEEMLFL